jgi:hypothetical protein
MWAIMSKVRWEAFMWGAGTALGELPPYFMARTGRVCTKCAYTVCITARLSGEESDNEEYREFLQFLAAQEDQSEGKPVSAVVGCVRTACAGSMGSRQVTSRTTGYQCWFLRHSALRFGACSCCATDLYTKQIPNPLFDLAGITCGHFGVPFWTFMSATLIGKAVIKMHIQVSRSGNLCACACFR